MRARPLLAALLGLSFWNAPVVASQPAELNPEGPPSPNEPTVFESRAFQDQAETQLKLGRFAEARELARRALEGYRQEGNDAGVADALAALGLADHLEGRLEAALDTYQQSLTLYRQVGDRRNEATVLANIGGISSQMGQAEQALGLYRQALELHRLDNHPAGELSVLNNLAVLHRQMGEPDEALRIYEKLVERHRADGNEGSLGRALNNQGFAYFSLGDFDRAALYFEQALVLRRRQGDRRGEYVTLSNLGSALYARGRYENARDYHQQALEIGTALGERGAAGAMGSLAQDLAALGDPEALPLFAASLARLEEGDEPRLKAEVQIRQADALLRFGKKTAARDTAATALARLETLGDGGLQAYAAVTLGRAEAALGRKKEALAAFRRAIDLLEKQRGAIENPSLRATLLASQRAAFENFAITAVENAETDPGALLEALVLLERGRARGLLDLLAEARLRHAPGGPDNTLIAQRRALLRRFSLLVREQDLIQQGKRQGDPAQLAASLEELRVQLDRLEADLRRDDPRLASLAPAAPPPPATWRRALDSRTRLLHFLLGETKSLVFVVGAHELEVVELPPRARLDVLVRQAAGTLASPTDDDTALAELSASVVAPLLPSLVGVERLWIVADGGLHHLPLAALPMPPGQAQGRMVDHFEITSVPSGGVLAELLARPRRQQAGPIAVFADPVFRPPDNTEPGLEPPVSATLDRVAGAAGLHPLPGTRLEAERIATLFPGRARLALGFAATRERFEQEAPDASILHLATHGLIDTDHPELSGLALSLFSAEGRWQPQGLVRLDDFTTLRLDAELVVLSGCRTALGRELDGEGLLSLSRGLFYAGSRRVLASLWPVRDRATAELMSRFYAQLLAGRPAASALRAAQRELAASADFRDPFYWAAFVLIGDPR